MSKTFLTIDEAIAKFGKLRDDNKVAAGYYQFEDDEGEWRPQCDFFLNLTGYALDAYYLCDVCNKPMKVGQATWAGRSHWDCKWPNGYEDPEIKFRDACKSLDARIAKLKKDIDEL